MLARVRVILIKCTTRAGVRPITVLRNEADEATVRPLARIFTRTARDASPGI